jgi:hypothetical protein
LQFAADGITDELVLQSGSAYWPIRRVARCDVSICGAMASPGVRAPTDEPPAIRRGGLNPMWNAKRGSLLDEDRRLEPLCMTRAPRLTVTRGPEFSRAASLAKMRSQRSSPLSRCGMNLLRMS